MSGGRSPKRKGVRIERALVQLLLEHGFVCARVPLSGAAGGIWSGDIHLELLNRTHRVEVKARRAFATLHGWLAKADLLLLKADRQPPLVVLPLPLLAELVQAGTDSPTPSNPPPELAAHISFDPIPGALFCACGAEIDASCLLRHSDGSAVITCRDCHAELAPINADLEIRT